MSKSGPKFRIREFLGKFTIEKGIETTKGVLWWKRKVYDWKPIDIKGNQCIYIVMSHGLVFDTYKTKMPDFDTLEEAQEMITMLNKGVVLHDIN